MANMIARLGVLLGLDTAEFNKGLDQAAKKLDQFGQAAEKYGKIAAAALVASGVAALKYADDIADVAKANDVAIDSILKLQNALANNGGEAENAGKLLASFTKYVDEAAKGSFEAQKHFAKAGVTLKDLGTLSTQDLFQKTVAGIAAIEDPLTRNARAMDAFGKAAKGVDFVGLNQDIQNGAGVTDDQARAIQVAADAFDMLSQHARDTAKTFAIALGPILKDSLEYIKDIKGESSLMGDALKTVFQTVAIVAANVAFVIKTIALDIKGLIDVAGAFLKGGPSAAGKVFDENIQRAERARAEIDQFERKVLGNVRNPNDPRRLDMQPGKPLGRPVVPGEDPELKKYWNQQAKAYAAQQAQLKELYESLGQIDKLEQGLAKNELDRQTAKSTDIERSKELMELEYRGLEMRQEDVQYQRELLMIGYEKEDQLKKIAELQLTDEERINAIRRENELAEQAVKLAKERYQLEKQTREGSFAQGVGKAARDFIRDLPTELENGQRAFNSVVSNMESALERFVKTGKFSFKDLTRSILQDLLLIQLRAQAVGIFKGLAGGLFGGSIFGSKFGGADIGGVGAAPYANGGDPTPNQVALVGERGPELFVPRTAGTIIPNHALSGVGGSTVVNNFSISAIDTKSFEDRLLNSPNAVWAANQYASKSLAFTKGRA